MKKIFFTTVVSVGVICCIINGFTTSWLLFLLLYIVTRICYNAANAIYDSMLNDITSEERMDEVSSYGYAWGYIGSCIPFLVALIAYVLGPDMVGVISASLSKSSLSLRLVSLVKKTIHLSSCILCLMRNFRSLRI